MLLALPFWTSNPSFTIRRSKRDAVDALIASLLIEKSKEVALEQGYRGLYTQGQDNNLGACLFYLNNGFVIGGLDTCVYQGTSQEGKKDILFYCESKPNAGN